MPSARSHPVPAPVVAALVAVLGLLGPRAAGPALGQCTYPVLTDDVPQTFTGTPQFLRFTQSAGRWAAVAVQSAGTANWDIAISLGTAAFPTCLTFPVVASQQTSGVDFVLGDFAAEGTGVRYAPISRASGTGNATVEWDSGARTAVVGTALNQGANPPGLIDCWNVDLVAGTSYLIRLTSEAPGDYRLYAFRRGASSSWRSRADALVEAVSNVAAAPILTATTTDRYALVVVRESSTAYPASFAIQPCVDPPDLLPGASLPIPIVSPTLESAFQFDPAGTGLPTVAARSGQAGLAWSLTVARHVDPGYYPCEGDVQWSSGVSGERVELMVGDQVTGAVPTGGTWWLGTIGPAQLGGRAEYSPGTDVLAVDGSTQYVVAGPEMVVRTFRADLVAGADVRIHVAKCGPASGNLRVFRPYDPAHPGNGWSTLTGPHAPVASLLVDGVDDFTFTPPVSGAYAFVLTNESAENACWELGISSCRARTELVDRQGATITANPVLAYDGEAFGTRHGRGGWSAVAVRPLAAGEDWVVEAWDAPSGGGGAPPFGCLSGLLGASSEDGTASPTDFLARWDGSLGDMRENVQTQHVYPAAHASPGGGARVLYEQWNMLLAVGDPAVPLPTGPADLVEVWNLDLVAGQTVSFLFDHEGFAGELFLFRPTGSCPGGCPPEYAHPGSAGMEFRTTTGRLFTPSETATYGLVLVNQDGGSGRYWLAVNAATIGAGPAPGATATTRWLGATPNPVAADPARLAFELARPARVGFEIVNLAGRVVARVAEAPFAAGRGSVAWAPLGAEGRRLAPGLYFARMRVDGEVVAARAKLTVLGGR